MRSARGELPDDQRVSGAQMGAFFAAMTIRRKFPEKTRWSEPEAAAFRRYGAELERDLPADVRFLMAPECGYGAANEEEEVVVKALEKILEGEHLTYEETLSMGRAILNGQVRDSFRGAALIGQRMNRETYEEMRGYLDSALAPGEIREVSVGSLAHFGEPFDGSTRYFRPTLFVAAVRAALGEATVLHGVDAMPPKGGVTEEQILNVLGARTDLSLARAASLIEDPRVGFCYVSQAVYGPAAYAARELRVHIKKRPPWAATEKAQRLFSNSGPNYMVIGYFHPGYEEGLLRSMWDRGFRAGLVIKGEEGTGHFALRLGMPSTKERKAVNYCQGFRRVGGRREDFARDVDPGEFGFDYAQSPRAERVTAEAFAREGRAALAGERGHVYDRIRFNAAVRDYLLGICPELEEALSRAKEAIDSGGALSHLEAFIEKSNQG